MPNNIQGWVAAASPFTITLASLASDATGLLVGRQGAAIDLTATNALDWAVDGFLTVGTTPTVNTIIEVHLVGSMDGTNWPDNFGAADAARTITSATIKGLICRPVAIITPVAAVSDRRYNFGPINLRDLFGFSLPRRVAPFVSHSTVAAFNATGGNHLIQITPTDVRF